MRVTLIGFALIASVATSGCGKFGGQSGPELNPDYSAMRGRWNATLTTPSGLSGVTQVNGTAMWTRGEGSQSTAQVSVSNATSGGVHPWHIHYGRCGSNGPIVGSAASYPPLSVGSDGKASASATLSMPAPASGDYYVNVHASQSNMGTIVACGNLAPPVP